MTEKELRVLKQAKGIMKILERNVPGGFYLDDKGGSCPCGGCKWEDRDRKKELKDEIAEYLYYFKLKKKVV
jgi:hypothetical protein